MKIKLRLILILSLSVWVQANNNTKADVAYQEINKQFSKAIKKVSPKDRKLLIPADMNNTLKVLKKYKQLYKAFTENKKEVKATNRSKELYAFYLNVFETIADIKLTGIIQFLARSDYEMRILQRLKKDYIAGTFSDEEKTNLMENLEKLLLLDKFSIYETQKNLNIFYANNMKQYFSIITEIPLNLIETKSSIYKNFIDALNKGEALILEGLKLDDFTNFKNFVDELEVSKLEIKNLVKMKDSNPTEFSKLYLDYWVRGQIYGRYLGNYKSIVTMTRHMEKEKAFFKSL